MAEKASITSAFANPVSADILGEARTRFKQAAQAENEQRERSFDDLKFCDPESQWPEDIRHQRDAEGRPCLTVDRLTPFIHQIVNENRQARPQPQVNPVSDGADKETAEIFQGMIRHIMYHSNGDVALDTAYESMVRCGVGYFRVLTDYADEAGFEQDILVKRIANPFLVYADPTFSEPDGSDMEWAFVTSYLPASVYRAEYPESQMAGLDDSSWKSIGDESPEWAQRDGAGCMVLEYFRRVRKSVTLCRMVDGSTMPKDKVPEGAEIQEERVSYQTQVEWYKLNAIEVLEKTIWPGKYIPIIPVLGTELDINGKRTWGGLIRQAKDAQRAFNYWKSAQAETIALAPRAPWVGPKGFMGNLRNVWKQVNRRPIAVLEYEAFDSQNRPLQPPTRVVQEPPIMAITNAMIGAVDDLKATTGMYDASLGNREANQSGVAIRQLQRQGSIGNYHYTDNLARSIRHLGRILLNLIPLIYDTKRTARILKPDDSTEVITVNGPSGKKDKVTGMEKVYDLSVGAYDVTVSVGPSYQTKRQENLVLLESMMQGPLGQLMAGVAPDLVVSMMDFQIAPELQERLKKMLPPALQEQQEGAPTIPPQVQQQMQQSAQMIEQLTQRVHSLTDQLEQEQAKVQGELAKEELRAQTDIKVAEIRASADMAKAQMAAGAPEGFANANELMAQFQDLQSLVLLMHDQMMGGRPAPVEGMEAPNMATPEMETSAMEAPEMELPAVNAQAAPAWETTENAGVPLAGGNYVR